MLTKALASMILPSSDAVAQVLIPGKKIRELSNGRLSF
jgi:hypothetical protein